MEGRATEDGVVAIALLLTLLYLVLMMSLPIWFSGFIQSISG